MKTFIVKKFVETRSIIEFEIEANNEEEARETVMYVLDDNEGDEIWSEESDCFISEIKEKL